MKNLIEQDIDKLDYLPTREKFPVVNRDRSDCPYKKIYKFLMSRIGKHWDDVYSEYVHLEWLPSRYRNLESLKWDVVFNTYIKEGKVYYFNNLRGYEGNELPIGECYRGYRDCFYVHPETKILTYQQKKKSSHGIKKVDETMKIIGDYHQCIKINGIWHEVKGTPVKSDIVKIDGLHYKILDKIPYLLVDKNYKVVGDKIAVPAGRYDSYSYENMVGPKDRLLKDSSSEKIYGHRKSLDYRSIKITSYKQLSHKQLKKYGLKNKVQNLSTTRCPICGGFENCYHATEQNEKYL